MRLSILTLVAICFLVPPGRPGGAQTRTSLCQCLHRFLDLGDWGLFVDWDVHRKGVAKFPVSRGSLWHRTARVDS